MTAPLLNFRRADEARREVVEQAIIEVCQVHGFSRTDLLGKKRGADLEQARRNLMTRLGSYGLSQQQIADVLGLDRSTISYHQARAEMLPADLTALQQEITNLKVQLAAQAKASNQRQTEAAAKRQALETELQQAYSDLRELDDLRLLAAAVLADNERLGSLRLAPGRDSYQRRNIQRPPGGDKPVPPLEVVVTLKPGGQKE